MKVAVFVVALALGVALSQAGGHGWGGYRDEYGYKFEKYGNDGYMYKRDPYDPPYGKYAKCEDPYGYYDCDRECGDPYCKATFYACGEEECSGREVCLYGKCYEYECKDGYKCYEGPKKVCKDECHKEKVYVCDGHEVSDDYGWRRLLGYHHGDGNDYYHKKDPKYYKKDPKYKHKYGRGSNYYDPGYYHEDSAVDGDYYDPGCHYELKEVCGDCKIEYGFYCTEEACEDYSHKAECGIGYCDPGDECYLADCNKACKYYGEYGC